MDIKYEGEAGTIPRNVDVEAENLAASDSLVAALDQRYPAPVEEKK